MTGLCLFPGPPKVEVLENGKRYRRGLNLWTISVSFFKKEFYKHLNLAKPTNEQLAAGFTFPAGYVHLPDTVSDEWIRQLVAEQQVIIRSRRGFATRTEWRQLRPRNEALDCRTYARAAVWLAGADRWSDARWHGLEEQLGLEAPPFNPVPLKRAIVTEQPVAAAADPAVPAPPIGGDIRRRLHAARRRVRW